MRRASWLGLAGLLGMALVPSLARLSAGATIDGTVQDEDGTVVARPDVVVRDPSTGWESRASGDEAGRFSVSGIPPGRYEVAVAAPGHSTSVFVELPLIEGGSASFRSVLKKGEPADRVEIMAVMVAETLSPLDARWKELDAQCRNAAASSCRALGDLHAVNYRHVLARAAYERACSLEDGLGCLDAAHEADDLPRYAARAVPLLEAACARHEAESCFALAEFLEAADEGSPRLAPVLEEACALGHARACVAVALAQPEREKDLLRRVYWLSHLSCATGHARDCLLVWGQRPKDDLFGAMALRRACALDDAGACDLERRSTP